jgi:acetolactate synthase-1/2/3 large subunit
MAGGDIVVRALEDEGVPFAFGIPGTHNIELYDALARSRSVRPILVTDEQSASFMADGVARSSGKLGCVNVVPGAGLTHAISGIAEAFLDGIPMLVLGCGVRSDSGMAYQLHDVDQTAMVGPVTKAQLKPAGGEETYATIRRACALARQAPPGPVFVEIPADQYLFRHEYERGEWDLANGDGEVPGESVLSNVRSKLAAAKRPLLYLGLGAAPARPRLVELAERLEAPVATTIQGKGVFPEHHPLWLWCGFGRAAPPFVRQIAAGCDATLAIGCRFSEVGTGSYGLAPPRPLIHVDVDEAVLGRNFATDLPVQSDSATFVPALLDNLAGRRPDPALREAIRTGHSDLPRSRSSRGDGDGVTPEALLPAIQQTYGRDAIYTADSGNGMFMAMEWLRLDRPRSFLAPVDYSCMGYAVPAALGAALACPDRPVVALAGDGAFLMTGLELLTASNLDLPVTVFVLRDGELAQIAQFQHTALASKTASQLPGFDLSMICRGLGVEYLKLTHDAQIASTLTRAHRIQAGGRPVLVEVEIDYSQPTFFTRGVVLTNLGRLPWPDRLRFVARAVGRRLPGRGV